MLTSLGAGSGLAASHQGERVLPLVHVVPGPEQPFKIKINRSALFVKAAIQSCCGEIDAAISMMNKLTMT